jgi:putative colanic acid biosynthesis acetyltransferase WcaF
MLWQLSWSLLFRPSPSRLLRFRPALLRLFGAKVAPTALVRSSCKIMHPWLLTMGEHACLGEDVTVYNLGPISIGAHTVVSQEAYLCAGTHDYTRPDLPLLRPSIEIGAGVWVCAKAFIGPGVKIGDNALVGACAVVVKDVPEGTIVAGNPARVIRKRPMGDARIS